MEKLKKDLTKETMSILESKQYGQMSKSPVKNRTKFSKEAETIIDLLAKTLSK